MVASILKLNSREDRNTIPLRMIDVLQVGIEKREVYHLALQSFLDPSLTLPYANQVDLQTIDRFIQY